MQASYVKLIVGVAAIAVTGLASAQFGGLGKLGGGGGSSVTADQIVREYVAGQRNVMSADANMLAAVGDKDASAAAALEAKNLTDGATKDDLEASTKIQTDSSKELQDKMNDKKLVLDANAKKQFSQGILDLSKGIIAYVGMKKDISGFKPSVTSIGASAGSAVYVVKTFPDSLISLSSTLKSAITFARANNIPVPQEATDATSML